MDADDAKHIKTNMSKKSIEFSKKEKESIKEIFDLDETKEMFPDANFEKAKQRIDNMSDDFSEQDIQEIKKYLFDNDESSDYDPNNVVAWKKNKKAIFRKLKKHC